MNYPQLHLAINHFPFFLGLSGSVFLLIGVIKPKLGQIKTAGLVLLTLGALSIYPSKFTGDEAEEAIEHMPGVSEKSIKVHDESADLSGAILTVAGILASLTLWVEKRKKKDNKGLVYMTLGAGLVGTTFVANTAHLGGLIRHPELSSVTAATLSAPESAEKHEADESEKDDD
jgi:uncharacterized membrane protein